MAWSGLLIIKLINHFLLIPPGDAAMAWDGDWWVAFRSTPWKWHCCRCSQCLIQVGCGRGGGRSSGARHIDCRLRIHSVWWWWWWWWCWWWAFTMGSIVVSIPCCFITTNGFHSSHWSAIQKQETFNRLHFRSFLNWNVFSANYFDFENGASKNVSRFWMADQHLKAQMLVFEGINACIWRHKC